MKRYPFVLRGLVDLFVLLPIVFQLGLVVWLLLEESALVGVGVLIPVFLYLCAWCGAMLVEKRGVAFRDDRAALRYLPVIVALVFTVIAAGLSAFLPAPGEGSVYGNFFKIYAGAHISSTLIPTVLAHLGRPSPWFILPIPFGIYIPYLLGMIYSYRRWVVVPQRSWWKEAFVAAGLLTLLTATLLRLVALRSEVPITDINPRRSELDHYRPFDSDNKLVKIADPQLKIEKNYPVLDGSTAVFPIYAAAAEAIYKNLDQGDAWRLIDSSKTSEAYSLLCKGKADIIFATPPSEEQKEMAAAAGVELQLTPFAREAFIVFVHRDNPVSNLTADQVRRIYKKEIRNWSEVGGANEPIIPFQRPAGSGSQTAFLSMIMKGDTPARPTREEFSEGMGHIIQEVAAYRNSAQAIGYSFRYYLTTMDGHTDVKMLSIDGVEPTKESIRSGRYPFTTELYAVTAGTQNPHAKALIEWFLSPQGQALVEEVGYVGVP